MTRRTAISYRLSGERGIGLGKRISRSLSAQLLCGALLSLTVAALALGLTLALGSVCLDHTVYGQPFARKMADKEFSKLEDYVAEEQISRSSIQKLNLWCNRTNVLSLTIYQGNERIYASTTRYYVDIQDEELIFDPNPEEEDPDAAYALTLSDGTVVQAYLYYYAGDGFYICLTVLAAAVAFLTFSVCFIALVHHKLLYITKLKEELDILSGGALEYNVTVQGEDELGQLAYGIDQMRLSILSHQQAEERARSASSHLVTAMSHDLRTPLTSLLAYLELIDRGKYEDNAQMHQFVKKSLDKAFRIKTMADQMFEYFLVYSAESEQPDMEPQDADTLMEQFWGEYAFSLESKGFTVETKFELLHGTIQVNIELLRRAFDNLYSNLLKYADSAHPIEISFRRQEGRVFLRICNWISPQKDKWQSTNIGLNTCQRILQYHGGTFSAVEKADAFEVQVTLPVQ